MKLVCLLTVFKPTIAAPSELPQCNACNLKPDGFRFDRLSCNRDELFLLL